MARIEAELPSSAIAVPAADSHVRRRRAPNRHIIVRTGAVVLAVLGIAALVVRPVRGTARAEAAFVVPPPLAVDTAVGAIRARADGAMVTAAGRRIRVASSGAGPGTARARVAALASAGLDAAGQRLTAVEARLAAAARSDRAQVTAQIAAMVSRTGLTDPEAEYRRRVLVVQDLVAQRARAAAAGRPLAAIDDQLAQNQEAVFELQLQVTRRAELTAALASAAGRERDATRAIETATRAVRSTPVAISVASAGAGFGLAVGGAALAIAGILFLLSARAPRRGLSADAVAELADEAEAVAAHHAPELAEPELALEGHGPDGGTRYSNFYRALAPSAPPLHIDPPASDVDLVYEEALEERTDSEPRASSEHGSSRPG